MCFNHYWVTVAATEKVTSSWLCFRLWNTSSCTVPFFLSLLCEELLSCHIHIYCFPGNCCSQSEEYHVREMKGDICWQFSTEVWLFSTVPSLSQCGMHTVVKECSESPSDQQAMGAQLLASPSAPVCAILPLLLALVWCHCCKSHDLQEYFSLVLGSSTDLSSRADLLFRISPIKNPYFVFFKSPR